MHGFGQPMNSVNKLRCWNSASSTLVALRAESQASTSLWFSWWFFKFSRSILYQHYYNFSTHFRRSWELHCELIKSKTQLEMALNNLKHNKFDFVGIDSHTVLNLRRCRDCLMMRFLKWSIVKKAQVLQWANGAKHSPLLLQLWWPSGLNLTQRVCLFWWGFSNFLFWFLCNIETTFQNILEEFMSCTVS